jgi:hypothetical protein
MDAKCQNTAHRLASQERQAQGQAVHAGRRGRHVSRSQAKGVQNLATELPPTERQEQQADVWRISRSVALGCTAAHGCNSADGAGKRSGAGKTS